jgi:hypothetical protein
MWHSGERDSNRHSGKLALDARALKKKKKKQRVKRLGLQTVTAFHLRVTRGVDEMRVKEPTDFLVTERGSGWWLLLFYAFQHFVL